MYALPFNLHIASGLNEYTIVVFAKPKCSHLGNFFCCADLDIS